MGRQPCCDKVGLKKGPWTAEEDKKLINFILTNGQCCWRAVPKLAGLLRCGKSCRLRWTNYLRPDLKRGLLSESEEKLVIELHSQLGNRWSKIAAHLPGRTDNEIKNHWNTHIKKKLRKMGIDPLTHKPIASTVDHHHHHHQQQQQQEGGGASAYGNGEGEQLCVQCPPNMEQGEAEEKAQEEAEEKSITNSFDPVEADPFLSNSPGFCTDEVPVIEPHEIIVPCASSAPSICSTASISSSCSSSSSYAKAEEFQLPCMEWSDSLFHWGLDDYMGLDFLNDDEDGKLGLDPFSQYQRTTLDLESLKFELF